jgi:hypothetical protein
MKNNIIQAIPINGNGDLLFLKDFEVRGENKTERYFIKYRAMINQIPFQETELYLVDNGKNFAITGSNAKILYRFPIELVFKINI